MPRKKKTTTSKVRAPGEVAPQGKRLTPEQRSAIAGEPASLTLAAIAEKYGTSINTVMRYRSGSGKRGGGRPKGGATRGRGDATLRFQAEFAGGQLLIRLSRADLLKALADSEP
jgi:hypothetical protein